LSNAPHSNAPHSNPPRGTETHSGVLLIGHGTRDETGTREFFELAGQLRRQLDPLPVQGCLLEFQEPTIEQAWQKLTGDGVRHVQVAPLLLFAAGHARSDIPDEIARCVASTPGVSFNQCGPLSRAPEIVDLLVDRVQSSLDCSWRSGDALVLVGRGSYDPCAQADMRVLGEVVARRLQAPEHAVAFYAMAEPKLPAVLDEIASRPGIRRVIVQPHLLFQGRLFDAIGRQVTEAAGRHPDVRFCLGDYLGPNAPVAAALVRRLEQAQRQFAFA
jgi:sirohydrochlorin cobaltochelatase